MQTTRKELLEIRARFEEAIERAKLSPSTSRRYMSWAKRFILHCRYSGIELERESVKYFLKGYSSLYTQRQGYFALKFLFEKAIKQDYIEYTALYEESIPKRRRSKWRRRRWW